VARKRSAGLIIAVVLIGMIVVVYWRQHNRNQADLYYSGTIEATEAELSFQAAGRVARVYVDDGYQVDKGQIMAELDRSEYQARRDEAQAGLEKAVTSLQELEVQLQIFRETLPAEVERAQANVASARDALKQAQRDKERYDSLVEQGLVSRQAGEQVTLQYDTGRYRLAESAAVLDQAQSNLKKIAAIEREIEAARAQIRVARATLDVATIQLGYAILRAPFSGIITVRRVEPGEVVSPGESVFSLADLSTVELKIFVPETDLGLVKPGQPVEVRTDTFPNTVYHGQVGYISPEGEFTPKIIQTHKERVKLVYLVKVIIPNPSLELKTGMPADAWLAELPDES